jgi:hypothetical protein
MMLWGYLLLKLVCKGLKLFKECLKAYSAITGSAISPFIAIGAAVKMCILSLSYMVLVVAKCNELLEHEIERFWPHYHMAAAAASTKLSYTKLYTGRLAVFA